MSIPDIHSKRKSKKIHPNLRQTNNHASTRDGKRAAEAANSDKSELRARCETLALVLGAKKFEIRHPNETLEAALKFHKLPWSIIPIKTDGSKASSVKWAKYQQEYATTADILEWFDTPNPFGIGVAHGILSGGSEAIDVDDPALVEAFERRLEDIAPGLMAKLIIVRTPREGGDGGRHYYYNFDHTGFCTSDKIGEDGNQKLAEREFCLGDISEEEAKSAGARRKDDGKWYVVKTLIETRGSGGYTIAPGSPAKTHPTGRPYKLIQGEFTREGVKAARITFDERATLLEVAHSFNEYVNPKKVISIPRTVQREPGDVRPGEAFDQSPEAFAKVRGILEKHGWQWFADDSLGELWTRPGKRTGVSARLFESGLFYVFSSNAAPFEPEQAYTPFGVLIELEYSGDASACARDLSAQGFGERPKSNASKATDNGTAILDGKIKLDVEPADRGKVKLTARGSDGNVIYRDVINLDSARDRETFIKALPLSDEESKTVQAAMLKIADTPITREAATVSAEERVMSKILSDGRIIEQLAGGKFAVYDPASDTFTYAESVEDGGVTYKPRDIAVDMRLPEKLTEYGEEAELDRRIEEVYRRYCDAPDNAIKSACKYVRMTYVVDLLNVLPYLKATGEPGSGKSRFGRVGVNMSYHPVEVVDITKAVLFRLVDECKPTLFIDEWNPDAGGEDTEGIIQVLNAGFQRGANVYRTEEPDANGKRRVGSYSPFGPKFLAGLKATGSAPFESRCIPVQLVKATRKDIRYRDTPKMFADCSEVASMLYLWRLRFLSKSKDAFETMLDAAEDDLKAHDVDPRFIQIATPLHALIEDPDLKKEFAGSLEKRTQAGRADKQDTFNGKIVRAVYDLIFDFDESNETVKQRRPYEVDKPIYEASITDVLARLIGEYDDLTDKRLGHLLTSLGFSKEKLKDRKHNGQENDKRNRQAVVYEPEMLKIFVSYGLPLPGETVAIQPNLVEMPNQIPFNLKEHPEPERVKKGR